MTRLGQCKVWKFELRLHPDSMAAQPQLDDTRTPRTNHHVVEAGPICVHSRQWQPGLIAMSNLRHVLYCMIMYDYFSLFDVRYRTCISVLILYFCLRACLLVVHNVELQACNTQYCFASNLVDIIIISTGCSLWPLFLPAICAGRHMPKPHEPENFLEMPQIVTVSWMFASAFEATFQHCVKMSYCILLL